MREIRDLRTRSNRICDCWGLAFTLAFLLAANARAAHWAHFDIDAGDAQRTLQIFIEQSSETILLDVVYLTDEVAGVRTKPVSGYFEVHDVLERMLEGTDLHATFLSETIACIVRSTQKSSVVTPFRSDEDATADTRIEREVVLKEVVVTGSLIHGAIDSVSALRVLDRRAIERSGYATVQDVVQGLPISFRGGISEDFGGVGNFARGVGLNLRGLGTGATLVLVNGRRQPVAGNEGDFVDVSNIPWSAVERIDVLPDGASALYGSDAIAGVVNIVMREIQGVETGVRIGATPAGAGERMVSQLFGHQWATGRATLAYQILERKALAAADRPYAANSDKSSFGGSDFRSFRASPGNILNPVTLLPTHGIAAAAGHEPTANRFLPTLNRENRYATLELLPRRRMQNVFFSASHSLGERLELFSEGTYMEREIRQRLHGAEQVLLVPRTNPFYMTPYPEAPHVLVGYSFIRDLGPIEATASTRSRTATLGMRADVSDGWNVIASGSFGQEDMQYAAENQTDSAGLARALSTTDPTRAFNPFSSGQNNPMVLNAIRATQEERAVSQLGTATVVADGPLFHLAGGTARLALGAEWRREQFERGARVTGRFDRSITSGFAELLAPLVGSPHNPRGAPRLELSLAGRIEHYSDFGTSANPKLGLRWLPWDSWKIRTSWGSSFRAPNLVDVYDDDRNFATLAVLPDPTAADGRSAILAYGGNNIALREERASTWTAGVDFVPVWIRGLSVSLTYYTVDYKDRIVRPGPPLMSDILLQESQWRSIIDRHPSRAQIDAVCDDTAFSGSVDQCKTTPIAALIDFRPRNLAATRTSGLDISVERSISTRLGNVDLHVDGTYVFKFDEALADAAAQTDILDTVGNPLALRIRGVAEWYRTSRDGPGLGGSLTLNHAGSYEDDSGESTRKVRHSTTLDARLTYRFPPAVRLLKDLSVALNVVNVFDSSPPFVDREAGYDMQNAQPNGRVVAFQLEKTW